MTGGGLNGYPHPDGESLGKKMPPGSLGDGGSFGGGGGSARGGCLPMMIAAFVVVLALVAGWLA